MKDFSSFNKQEQEQNQENSLFDEQELKPTIFIQTQTREEIIEKKLAKKAKK